MSFRSRYFKGDNNAICDVCGRKYKASQLRRRWDNYMVCPDDWEPRQPQDFVRGVADVQVPPFTRPEQQDVFVLACSTRTSIAGFASAGCMIAGNLVNPGTVPPSTFNEP